jgi:hypothetical protein
MTLKDAALGSGALETDEDVARYEAILFGKFWLTKWMSEVSSPLPVWIEAWTMWGYGSVSYTLVSNFCMQTWMTLCIP